MSSFDVRVFAIRRRPGHRAVAYAAMKWPHLAAHSRASMAEALATVTRC